jgi:hypothetical protein
MNREFEPLPLPTLQSLHSHTAVVLDLAGVRSVAAAVYLARAGYRPVPLFNAAPGPLGPFSAPPRGPLNLGVPSPPPVPFYNTVIHMLPLVEALCTATEVLAGIALAPDAPPAFLLDSIRLTGERAPREEMFDNRWMVFPQDFPSAAFLLDHGIRQAVLVQENKSEPQDDLAHVLLRWQKAGIEILSHRLDQGAPPVPLTVRTPSWFRAAWYRALAIVGLRRSSAGGFGSYIPETSSGGYG